MGGNWYDFTGFFESRCGWVDVVELLNEKSMPICVALLRYGYFCYDVVD